jgi:hypothetical protein
MKKHTHMNRCLQCRKPFDLHLKSVDYCEKCCILDEIRAGIFDIPPVYEDEPEIVREIMRRYMIAGYE